MSATLWGVAAILGIALMIGLGALVGGWLARRARRGRWML